MPRRPIQTGLREAGTVAAVVLIVTLILGAIAMLWAWASGIW